MASKLRVLVVGVGSIGERHLRCFGRTKRAELSICEINDALRDQIRDRYAVANSFRALPDALEHPVDAAVICTPAHLHMAMAQELGAAGCHLLVEKPLATNLDQVELLSDLIRDRGLVVAVAYVNRVHPVLIEMHAAIREGRIGRILQVVATSGQHFPYYRPAYRETYYTSRDTGGGAIQDALTHLLNLGEWFGGPITDVAADAAHLQLPGVDVEDTVHVMARHGDILASYSLNQHQTANETTVTVVGSSGTAQYLAHQNRWQLTTAPEEAWQQFHGPLLERDDLFERQAEMFLDAVEFGRPVACDLSDGAQTLRANLAVLAAADGRCWQTLANFGRAHSDTLPNGGPVPQ